MTELGVLLAQHRQQRYTNLLGDAQQLEDQQLHHQLVLQLAQIVQHEGNIELREEVIHDLEEHQLIDPMTIVLRSSSMVLQVGEECGQLFVCPRKDRNQHRLHNNRHVQQPGVWSEIRQHLGFDLKLVEGKPAGGNHTAQHHRIRDAVHLQVCVPHRIVECHLAGDGVRFQLARICGSRLVQAAHLNGAPSIRVAGTLTLPQLQENLKI
uniref:MIP13627p n=1 Tax=Drosophila melanogaster TaxID=7227 RepID=D0IQF9_DROME|nr:MIP13627p [Drosophila melanogaster]